MSEHLRLTFPEDQVTEPVIYHIVKDFDVVPNIRRAAIENHFGWLIIELDGTPSNIDAAKAYLTTQGIKVDSAEGDIVAGSRRRTAHPTSQPGATLSRGYWLPQSPNSATTLILEVDGSAKSGPDLGNHPLHRRGGHRGIHCQ